MSGGKPPIPDGFHRLTTIPLARVVSDALLLSGSDGLPVPPLFLLIAEYAVGACELTVVAGQRVGGRNDGVGTNASFACPHHIIISRTESGAEFVIVQEETVFWTGQPDKYCALRRIDLTDSTYPARPAARLASHSLKFVSDVSGQLTVELLCRSCIDARSAVGMSRAADCVL